MAVDTLCLEDRKEIFRHCVVIRVPTRDLLFIVRFTGTVHIEQVPFFFVGRV